MKMVEPRVLVLMATYNGSPWIIEQIESILSQNSVNIFILIRDDASQDSTLEVLKNRYSNKNNIDIRCSAYSSGSAGENFKRLYVECNLSKFDYVALSDQDDIWHPDKIKHAIQQLKLHGASGYSSAVEAFWPDGRKKIIRQSSRITNDDFLYEGCGQGCTCVIEAAVFKRVADFCKLHSKLTSSLHYHDWLIYLLLRVWGYKWFFDKNSYIKYRQHANNEIGARANVASVFARLQLIKNGWYSMQLVAAFKIARAACPLSASAARRRLENYEKATLFSKVSLCMHIFKYGRRRIKDRVALILAVLIGWVKIDLMANNNNL